MGQHVIAIQYSNIDRLPTIPVYKGGRSGRRMMIRKEILETGITSDHVRDAASRLDSIELPVYELILLDALAAGSQSQIRSSILYSAIAVEVLVRSKLDDAIDASQVGNSTSLRFVNLPDGRGGTELKDPVFRFLADKARLPELLHEVSLYALGRSLRLQNERLYVDLLRLFRTRNRLVHEGDYDVPVGDRLSIDHSGANEAAECAIDAFSYYGEEGPYHHWADMVEFNDAGERTVKRFG